MNMEGSPYPIRTRLAEFKIQTSHSMPDTGGTQARNVVTKSGGNDFHGAAWEFVRNDIFNANDFFRNSAGQSKPNFKQKPVRRLLRRPDHQEQAILLRFLPGDTADKRVG